MKRPGSDRGTIKKVEHSCPACHESHEVAECNAFITASANKRYEIIKSTGFCFRCLKHGHLSTDCTSKTTCEECNRRHHTLLHGAIVTRNRQPEEALDPPTQQHFPKTTTEIKAEQSSPTSEYFCITAMIYVDICSRIVLENFGHFTGTL